MIHSDLTLRLAEPADAAIIANMSRVLIEYGLRWRWTAKRVEASIRAINVNVLVARIDERIIGFGIMRYGDDDAHLDLFAVAPGEMRRRGGNIPNRTRSTRQQRSGPALLQAHGLSTANFPARLLPRHGGSAADEPRPFRQFQRATATTVISRRTYPVSHRFG